MTIKPFETRSVTMQQALLVTFQSPPADVERILDAVIAIVPLTVGKYDNNAYLSAPGIERYRPREGAVAGTEDEVRRRPGIIEVSFELTDETLLDQVVEAIFEVHCYQEPVIRVQSILTSRSRGLDDSRNPHRWWNTVGDWKKQARTPVTAVEAV